MADDNKQGFWDYMWEEGIKNNPVLPWNAFSTFGKTVKNVYEGIGNVASGHPWDEDNPNLITGKATEPYRRPHKTLEQYRQEAAASGDVPLEDIVTSLGDVSVNGSNAVVPQDLLGLNDYSDVDTNTEGGDGFSIGTNYFDVEKNLTLKGGDRERLLEEKIIKDEEAEEAKNNFELGFWDYMWEEGIKNNPVLKPFKWAKDIINSTKDTLTDVATENTLDAIRQQNQRYLAVGYDPESKNVSFMVFNTGQGLSDDFHDTFTRVGETKEREFDMLINQYQVGLAQIEMKEDMDEMQKFEAMDALTDELVDQINKRQIFKAWEDDYYSNGGLLGAFGRNVSNLIHGVDDDSLETFGRRYEQFSEEELEKLAKNNIKSGPLEINREMLQKFLEIREKNANYNNMMTYDGVDSEYNINYALTDESRSYMKAVEENKVYGPVMEQLNIMLQNGEIDEMQASEMMEAAIADVGQPALAQMHVYMDSALGYYVAVRNKEANGNELTDGERAILGYGPGLFEFLNDYSSAVSRLITESMKQGVENGVWVGAVDSIDGMSIQDFFKDAIYDSNLWAGGLDLEVRESAIDAMQHINQNIARLYWTGKGNIDRRMKTELNALTGGYGYIAGEIGQDIYTLGLRGLDELGWDGAGKLADYSHADFSRGLMLSTDYSIWGDKNRGRLLATFGLQASENIPEIAGTAIGERPLLKWNIGKRSMAESLARINKIKNAVKREKRLASLIKAEAKGQPSLSASLNAVGSKLGDWLGMGDVSKAIVSRGFNLLRRKISDQVIDSTLSYFDTENYSTPSYLISLVGTGLFETFPGLLKDTELLKMVKNKLSGKMALDGTGWKLMSVITSDDEIAKRRGAIYGLDYDSFRFMAKNGAMDNLEDLLRYSYQALDPNGKRLVDSLSKEVAIKTLNEIKQIDWKSTYGKNLLRIMNNNKTNGLDIWKFVLGIPGKVEFAGFQSGILFKEGAETQGRYLLKEYDVELDRIDGQFRKKLENGFTENDIKQIAERTSHKDVMVDGKVNKKFFVEENGKYILNSEGAEALGLKVSEYTEAMRKADILKRESEGVEKMLNEKIEKLAEAKGISKETISRLAKSGAFTRMVKEFEVFC